MSYSFQQIEQALSLLSRRLKLKGTPHITLVVCGGTALMAASLQMRVTKDVDVVAMIDDQGVLVAPELPEKLKAAAKEVALDLGLPADWLNNGPSSGPGGLFQLGLPHGIQDRLIRREFGENLTVCFTGRFDQIFFKLYAAVDRMGSYHADDLCRLAPTDEELLAAAAWAKTQDPSEGFASAIREFMERFGYEHLASKL